MVKNQSWEKRRQTSKKIRETDLKTHTREGSDHNSTETIECLQDHLKREMDEHIRGHLLSQSKCFKEPTSEAVSVCVCVCVCVCVFLARRGKRGCREHTGESGENPAAGGGSQGGESENGGCYRKSRHLSTSNT